MEILIGVLATLLSAALLRAFRAGWHRRQDIVQLVASIAHGPVDWHRRRRASRMKAELFEHASRTGVPVPIARRGSAPARVFWTDGSETFYFCNDLAAYKRALGSGAYPPDRTFLGNPPAVRRTA